MLGMLGVIVLAASVPIVSAETLWLMGGGALGAFLRALRTGGQKNLGLETVHDCFIGVLIGALWTIEIPGLSLVWPPFGFSPAASQVQRALLVGAVVFIAVEGIKQALMKWGQGYLAKLGVQETPKKEDKPDA